MMKFCITFVYVCCPWVLCFTASCLRIIRSSYHNFSKHFLQRTFEMSAVWVVPFYCWYIKHTSPWKSVSLNTQFNLPKKQQPRI